MGGLGDAVSYTVLALGFVILIFSARCSSCRRRVAATGASNGGAADHKGRKSGGQNER